MALIDYNGCIFGSFFGFGFSGDVLFEEVVQLGDIQFGFLQHFDFSDYDVVEGVDEGARLGDGLCGGVGQQVLDEVGEGVCAGLLLDDVSHFFPDDFDGLSLGVTGLADLVGVLLGESDHEHSHHESVQGFNLAHGFDQRLPLADEVAQFVTGHVHSVERSTTETAFNVFNLKLHFSPRLSIR